MADGLGLYLKDLYPNYSGIDTTDETIPDVSDKDALGEEMQTAEKATVKESSRKNIFLALGILICLVVFLGASK